MHVLLTAVAALWGAGTGLLVPRAAYRLAVEPEEPWRGACPAGHPITGPAGGWLGRSRCADPGAPACAARSGFGPGTAGVAVIGALIAAALAAAVGPRPELAVWLLAVPVGVLLALVDKSVHRLPDLLTLPLAAAVAVLLGVAALLPGSGGSWPLALLGGLVLGAAYFLLFLINPSGMGFGDVKLALALGAALGWYGWSILVTGAALGLLLGGVYGIGLMALRKAGRRSSIPLGPFMLGGAFLGLLLGGIGAG
ncbi:prepilin peptidase [Streptomyces sp. NPDC058045]|uniref:prepilin peptidase n=1 Tax=Streptomyces sp. NPDC058045 TaxID=3346311 RepID=UPI0036E26673